MHYESIELVVFSPTGTTCRVAAAAAAGIGCLDIRLLDYTKPAVRAAEQPVLDSELVVLAAPVYSGRLPAVAAEAFGRLTGNGSPAVLLVVYGNRAYEDALLELNNIAVAAGFVPAAAGAFIGEHSYSTSDFPLAAGRPDAEDCRLASDFGRRIKEKLAGTTDPASLLPLAIPGNLPYRERSVRTPFSPATNAAACRKCGVCTAVCPVGAVADGVNSGSAACLLCHACVRQCPAGARSLSQPRLREVRQWLHREFSTPRQPELFL